MKKKLSLLLVVIMVMMMGMSTYAAQSPTTDTTVKPEDTVAPNYGNVSIPTGSIKVDGVVVGAIPEVKPVTQSKVDEAQKLAEKEVVSTAKVLQVVDVKFTDAFLESVKNQTGSDFSGKTFTTTFDVNGVVAGQKLVLLVQKTDGTWVKINPDQVANGKVTATFGFMFNTVAFVAYNASAQTGQMLSFVPVMMGACATGMAVCAKKAKKDN